jgi:hypothetical protein
MRQSKKALAEQAKKESVKSLKYNGKEVKLSNIKSGREKK